MSSFRACVCNRSILPILVALLLMASGFTWPDQEPQSQEPQSQEARAPASNYDKTVFQQTIPREQLAFLNHFAGMPTKDVIRDKQFRKLMRSVLLDCNFHYGRDMSPTDAFEKVLNGSPLPVQIRDGRYVIVAGRGGPYLRGRGFLWFDLQEGIALAGFYFRPTNGEPTPTVTVFSRQIKEETLRMSQLPPTFAEALSLWSEESGVAPVTTRYFIGGVDRKILLEHDEDYCAPVNPGTASSSDDCEQMNADAADIDLNAAYFLDQAHYATNATAWMIGPDQAAWIQVRDNTCSMGPDHLRCRIRVTRERIHLILNQNAMPHPPHK